MVIGKKKKRESSNMTKVPPSVRNVRYVIMEPSNVIKK